jgi:hypothetical protein
MSVTTRNLQDRHLTAVADYAALTAAAETSHEIFRLAVAIATGMQVSALIPADVLEELGGLDADRYRQAHGLAPNFYRSLGRGPHASVRLPGGFRVGRRL